LWQRAAGKKKSDLKLVVCNLQSEGQNQLRVKDGSQKDSEAVHTMDTKVARSGMTADIAFAEGLMMPVGGSGAGCGIE